MPLPTSYTEDTFATYLHSRFAAYADIFGWSIAGNSYDEIINDTLLMIGASDITTLTDIESLRVVGQLMLWRAAMDAAGAYYDFRVDTGDFKRSQMFKAIQSRLEILENDPLLQQFNEAQFVTITPINHTPDPYDADRSNWYENRLYDE